MTYIKKFRNSGFTLVELSIVIIIIGFLIAGIAVGQSLISSARLNKAIGEITNFDMVFTMFQKQYGAMPGDMSNASSYWPTASDGNANDRVDTPNITGGEAYYVWQHLGLSGLINGHYSGSGAVDQFDPGVNVPISPLPNTVYHVISDQNWGNYSLNAPRLYLMHSDLTNYSWASVGVTDAANIDQKLDDGNPFFGKVVSWGLGGGFGLTDHRVSYDLSVLGGGSVPTSPRYLLENGSEPACVLEWGLFDYTFKGLGQ